MAKGKEAIAAEKRRNTALLEKQTELMIQIAELKTENGMLSKQIQDLEVQHDRALRTGTLLTERDDALAMVNGLRDELETWKSRTFAFAKAVTNEINVGTIKLPMDVFAILSEIGMTPDGLQQNRHGRRATKSAATVLKKHRLVEEAYKQARGKLGTRKDS